MAHATLTLDIESDHAELAADALFACGAAGLQEEGTRRKTRLVLYAGSAAELEPIRAALPAALAARGIGPELYRVVVREDEHSNWEGAYFEHLRALELAPGFWLKPTHDTTELPRAAKVVVYEPAFAFGDGSHATTRLAACALLESLSQRPRAAVLDYGCGNGVLALLAVLAGAERAHGVDIDPRSVQAAAHNAARNGVSERATFSIACPESERFELVVANMERPALIESAAELVRLTESGGTLLMTGFLESQRESVLAAFPRESVLKRSVVLDDWALIELEL